MCGDGCHWPFLIRLQISWIGEGCKPGPAQKQPPVAGFPVEGPFQHAVRAPSEARALMTDSTHAEETVIKTYGCQMNVYDSERMAEVARWGPRL